MMTSVMTSDDDKYDEKRSSQTILTSMIKSEYDDKYDSKESAV